MRSLFLLTALAGCAPTGMEPHSARADELAVLLAGRAPGPAQSCVSETGTTALRVIDSRTIVYERGRTVWVNRLRADCPGLRADDPLIIKSTGSGYCRGDQIRSFEPYRSVPGPLCVLGDFVPHRRP
jgi:hypothetical protein